MCFNLSQNGVLYPRPYNPTMTRQDNIALWQPWLSEPAVSCVSGARCAVPARQTCEVWAN